MKFRKLPPLSKLTLTKKIKSSKHPTLGKDHTTASGYLRYRHGTFSVATWFKDQAEYWLASAKPHEGCIPEIVVLTLQFDAPLVTLVESELLPGGMVTGPVKDRKTLAEFDADGCVFLSNNPLPEHAHHASSHFALNLKMTDGDEIATVRKAAKCPASDPGSVCLDLKEHKLQPLIDMMIPGEITCSNTGWP